MQDATHGKSQQTGILINLISKEKPPSTYAVLGPHNPEVS
jgi:hypothetical protein